MFNSFKHPSQKLQFQKYKHDSPKAKHINIIQGHYYNQRIDVVVPGCETLPPSVLDTFSGLNVYTVRDACVTTLLRPEFLEAFVRRGKLYVLSRNTNIDTDDCLCITPTGKLVLNISKDTHELLGITAKKSDFDKKKKRKKYVIELDLSNEKFTEGNNFYDNCVKRFLAKRLHFDLIVTWIPNDPKVSETSIGQYFKFHCGLDVQLLPNKGASCKSIKSEIPVLFSDDGTPDEELCMEDLYEWLGVMALDIKCIKDKTSDQQFLSSYECPGSTVEGSACVVRYTDCPLLTTDAVLDFIDKLREHAVSTPSIPWFAVTVQGHNDAPVSWYTREHGCLASANEQSSYTFVVITDLEKFEDEYNIWVYKSVSSLDTIP